MRDAKSMGGFLGLNGGPEMGAENSNPALTQINHQNSFYDSAGYGDALQKALAGGDLNSIVANSGMDAQQQTGLGDMLATGALTGSQYATQQVQKNPILGQLFGTNGALSQATQQEEDLSKNGFQLQPQDREAFGQVSGDISRQFGQSENDLANSLASRGLSSGASGAAGAAFSGLQGNKNEMLAQSQMQIANQRYNQTSQRLGQLQNFTSQLGAQGQNAINSQYERQLQGAQSRQNNLLQSSNALENHNNNMNASNLASNGFNVDNTPGNVADMMISNLQGGSSAKAGAAGTKQGQQSSVGGMAGMAAMAGA